MSQGLILFADDKIHDPDTPESNLFDAFKKETPTVGVHNLDLASSVVLSAGALNALILDWSFEDEEEDELDKEIADELAKPMAKLTKASRKEDETLQFLLSQDFYSLIYIFSNEDVEERHGERLRKKFGERIQFHKKQDLQEDPDNIRNKILGDIKEWEESNKNLSVPIRWSSAISQSIQKIFTSFSEADSDWIREIHFSAKKDGVDPELFVIELLQLILSEQLVQNTDLITSLKEEGSRKGVEQKDTKKKAKALAKLFNLLYYSELKPDAPVMTGDFIQLGEDQFGIIMTPECDIGKVKNRSHLYYDVLVISKESYEKTTGNAPFKLSSSKIASELKKRGFEKVSKDDIKKILEVMEDESLSRGFSQAHSRFHFLPSYPHFSKDLNESAVIDFTSDSVKISSSDLDDLIKKYPRKYKLNSPFIQQLRQRYLSHVGRIGVPALPHQVRLWNLGAYPNKSKM